MGMLSPYPIANEIIKRAIDEKNRLSPMKLQKLIWFVYGRHIADYPDEKDWMFAESFLAWHYGPVLRSVYSAFASFGSSNINKYARDAKGLALFLNDEIVETQNLISTINKQWIKYKDYNGIELSRKTHEQGTPWFEAYKSYKDMIPVDEIRKYFEENVDE